MVCGLESYGNLKCDDFVSNEVLMRFYHIGKY